MIGFNPLYAAVLALLGPQPSVALDFGYTLPAQITFSRASNATQYDAAGNLTWAPHNLCTRANQFSNWVSLGTDGTVNTSTGVFTSDGNEAAQVTWTAASPAAGFHISSQPVVVGAPRVVMRVKLRYVNHEWVRVLIASSADTSQQLRVWVNLQTGALGTSNASGTGILESASISALQPDGFYIVTLVGYLAFANSTDGFLLCASATGDGVSTRAGNGAAIQLAEVMFTLKSSFSGVWNNSMLTNGAAYYGPRLDYDPVTGTPWGLRIEEARTNLNPTSVNAGSAGATSQAGSFASYTLRSQPMVAYTADGTTIGHLFYGGTVTPAASTTHYLTAHVGPSSNNLVQLTVSANFPSDSANTYINFNTSTGTVVATGSAVSNVWVKNLGGGDYRIGFAFATQASPTGGAAGILAVIDSAGAARIPTITSSATIRGGGFQLEVGTFPTTYIPTFGTAATRAADTVDLPGVVQSLYAASGISFSTEVVKEVFPTGGATGSSIWMFGDSNTNLNGLFGYGTARAVRTDMVNAGVAQAQLGSSTLVTPGVPYKLAVRFAPNDAIGAANGALTPADNTVTMPASIPATRNAIGRVTTAEHLNGCIRKLQMYTIPLTNTQLQALTA